MMRRMLLFGGASLLMLTALVSFARRESVEPYHLEFVRIASAGGLETCRLFYYNRPQDCGYLNSNDYSILSPDGQWRAVTSISRIGKWAIYRLPMHRSAGWTPNVILDVGDSTVPIWSPDGKWLAYSSQTPAHERNIFRFEVATGEVDTLTVRSGDEIFPAWSPDSQRIAYNTRDGQGIVRLFTMRADGSDTREVVPGLHQVFRPQWSPDGEWLLFQSYCADGVQISMDDPPCESEDFDLYRLRLEDGLIEEVVAQSGDEYDPVWSPDGQWIAYTFRENPANSPQILRVRPDGLDVQVLTNNRRTSYAVPSWAATADLKWRPIFLLTIALVMVLVTWRMPS